MPRLRLEADHLRVVEILRNFPALHFPEDADPLQIPRDVARVLHIRLHRFRNLPGDPLKLFRQIVPRGFRTAEPILECFPLPPVPPQQTATLLDPRLFFPHAANPFRGSQAQLSPFFGQPQVGIILAEEQTIFRPGGEHTVRLARSLRDEIVDHDADVGLVAPRFPRGSAARGKGGVYSRQDPLPCGLLIARSAIELAGKKKSPHRLGFQRWPQLGRWTVVVLHRIAGSQKFRRPQAWD